MAHPLHQLSAAEITDATATFHRHLKPSSSTRLRWIEVSLEEPSSSSDREALLWHDTLGPASSTPLRAARVVVYDGTSNTTYEGVVALDGGAPRMVEGPRSVPGVQPAMTADEYEAIELLVKEHPGFVAAVAARGFPIEQICVDPWCVGYFGPDDAPDRRLAKPLVYVREAEGDNLYGRPLEGIHILIDLQFMAVVEFEDRQRVPVPPADPLMDYVPPAAERTTLRPLEISQPAGPSFRISDANVIEWERWRFRVGFTPREGVVLHTVTYEDTAADATAPAAAAAASPRRRPVAHRLSIAEMVVPYGDPDPPHYLKNAFDAGEDGLGRNAHTLEPDGCDCLGHIEYLDAALVSDANGEGRVLERAVCVHEEDAGLLWKHIDWRTDQTEVRRARRLVVSFICTIANYEYGFYWHFGMDGAINLEVKLTGILSTGALLPSDVLEGLPGRPYGTTLNADGLYAPSHQHFFVARLDMAVDGMSNTVVQVDAVTDPPSARTNPYANAFRVVEEELTHDATAARDVCAASHRHWLVRSGGGSGGGGGGEAGRLNRTGRPTAYGLHARTAALPLCDPSAAYLKRAGFLQHHLWVTPYEPSERYPGGDYPNQAPVEDGLAKWTKADGGGGGMGGGREIAGRDLVVWHVFGVTHVPRLEDWPVMPVETTGFGLRPVGFFDASPCMDVPPTARVRARYGDEAAGSRAGGGCAMKSRL